MSAFDANSLVEKARREMKQSGQQVDQKALNENGKPSMREKQSAREESQDVRQQAQRNAPEDPQPEQQGKHKMNVDDVHRLERQRYEQAIRKQQETIQALEAKALKDKAESEAKLAEALKTKEASTVLNSDVQRQIQQSEVTLPQEKAANPTGDLVAFAFRDLFVKDELGHVVSQKGTDVTVKNLQEAFVLQGMDDLKNRYMNASVRIGSKTYVIDVSNRVFTTRISFIRYSALMTMDEELRIGLCRQMFLTRYPNGETALFDANSVNSDELDIYKLVLVSSHTASLGVDQRLEQLALDVKKIKDTTHMTHSYLISGMSWLKIKLHGLSHVVSWLFLERTALNKGQVPKEIKDVAVTMSDKSIPQMTRLMDTLGSQQVKRDETMARTERQRGRSPHYENDGPSR